jgi:TonB family protein
MKAKLRITFHFLSFMIVLLCGIFVTGLAQTPKDGPVVVAAVAPVYPPIAAAAIASGEVVVEVKIDGKGTVTSARAISGHPLLHAVSVAAARRWKFGGTTETQNQSSARLTFAFSNTDDDASESDRTAIFFPPYKVQIAGPRVVKSVQH